MERTRLRSSDVLRHVVRHLRVRQGINAGTFIPADPTSWVCSPKFCGWYATCEHGARKRVAVGLVDPSRLVAQHAEMTYDVPEDI